MPIQAISSDGKWLAYQTTENATIDVYAVPLAGGEVVRVLESPHQEYHPFFSPSGRWLYYQRDHRNLYRVPGPAQDWKKAEPVKVTEFPEFGLLIEDAQTSPDGKQLLYSRGHISADVWLLRLQ